MQNIRSKINAYFCINIKNKKYFEKMILQTVHTTFLMT